MTAKSQSLVERLRLGEGTSPDHFLLLEAADEIERLQYALRANVALLAAFVGPDYAVGQAILKTGRDALAPEPGEKPA